ncbi:MAG: hypothetical protein ABJE95_24855 [Byssovorax sp.]
MLPRSSLARAGVLGLGLALAALSSIPVASCSGGQVLPPPLPDGGAGGSGGGGSTTAAVTATASSSASTGTSMTTSVCDMCVDTACSAEEAACDGECLAIQACLETVCFNLSMIGALAEEGQCQVKCQGDHPDGKDAHLGIVNCANAAKCTPPCTFYPQDYNACKSFMTKGPCQTANQACKDSNDCQTYKDCVSTCTTQKECIACDDTASGLAGRKLLESYELCVAGECTGQAWLP